MSSETLFQFLQKAYPPDHFKKISIEVKRKNALKQANELINSGVLYAVRTEEVFVLDKNSNLEIRQAVKLQLKEMFNNGQHNNLKKGDSSNEKGNDYYCSHVCSCLRKD